MNLTCPYCKKVFKCEVDMDRKEIDCPECCSRLLVEIFVTGLAATTTQDRCESVTPEPDDLYLDIETTGLESDADITVVAWLKDGIFSRWIKGESPDIFLECFKTAQRIVTFNGNQFDLPRICALFGVNRPLRHLDIMRTAHVSGLTGGLKAISQSLGIQRPSAIDECAGGQAVAMWNYYQSYQDTFVLAKLVYYCAWDVYLTYCLHMSFSKQNPDGKVRDSLEIFKPINLEGIEDVTDLSSVPDNWHPIMPERPPTNKKADIWQHRKSFPLVSISGSTVCITGDLTVSRDVAEKIIKLHGGEFKKAVSKALDFLVVGINGGWVKLDNAKENIGEGAHTRIINEKEFWELVRSARTSEAIPTTQTTSSICPPEEIMQCNQNNNVCPQKEPVS